MKYKSITTVAILAMFLASSMCVLCSVSDVNGTTNANPVTVDPITITNDGASDLTSWGSGASYDKNTCTLTLNSINAECAGSPIVKSTIEMLTIVVEGDVTLKCTKPASGDDSTCVHAIGYSLIIWGNENSSLDLIPSNSESRGRVTFGINADYLYIENCKLTIGCDPNADYYHFIGIQSFGINIVNSDVTINGKYKEGMSWDVGIRNDYSTNIKKSKLTINDVTRGITAAGHIHLGGEMGGTCIVNDSEIEITCANDVVGVSGTSGYTGSSIGLNLNTLIATNSKITATGGTCKYDATDIQGASVGINVHVMTATGCDITCSGKLWDGEQYANVSSGLEFWMNVELDNCTLKCTNEGGKRVELQSAIKSQYGVLAAKNSTIVAINNCTDSNRNHGIGCNSEFTNCKVDAKGIDGAYYSNRVISIKDVGKLQGFDETEQKWVDITVDEIFGYKEVRTTYQTSSTDDSGMILILAAVVLITVLVIGPILFAKGR